MLPIDWLVRFQYQYIVTEKGCWEYSGQRREDGYGRIQIKRKNWGTHKLSWVLVNGEIPEGLCVLHDCDNPPCINPKHLFLGTQFENIKFRDSKGRNKGLLTKEQILKVKERNSLGLLTQADLAVEFGVSIQTIQRAIYKELVNA